MGGIAPAGTIQPEPPERFFSKGRSGLHFLPRKMDQPSASNDCAGHRLGAARPATVFLRYERSDSFLSRTSDSAAVPIFFPGSNRLDLFSRGDFSSSVNWRSDPMRPADQRGPKGRESLSLSVPCCAVWECEENRGALWRPHSGHKFWPDRADPLSSVLPPNGGEDALQLRGDVGPHKGIGGGPTQCAHELAPVPDLGQSAQRAIQGTLPLSGHPID